MKDDTTVTPVPVPDAPVKPAPVPDAPVPDAPVPEVRSNNAEQGAGQHEPHTEELLPNETLEAFATRMNRTVDSVLAANRESLSSDMRVLPDVTRLVVPDRT